ncbi:hypothetical protein FH608_006275 [Nonomuraea phyllanthi]|uniref:Uncharacterized protein n=1 Tax=Nonomuraea phyllanthi TaxID=2219224 RepID=A0A5C4WRW9_9ACTN|nr:hypothetical protein [Nonomuraea phyllanthi]KAB8196360.1 hypothetical protein FH608_006275 [Nonomuraea phyllanthi]
MPKPQEISGYAAAIAPVIDAVHVNVHASARRSVAELSGTGGFLVDLRFTLPLRSLTRADLATIYRYGDPEGREAGIREHLREGTLAESGDGQLRLTAAGLAYIHRLYEVHGAVAERIWAGHDLPAMSGPAGRVLDRAQADRVPGGALELMAPPYEPDGAGAGLLLFNRLAALRYHRADAHAAAWQAEGLSAAEIVGLRDGPVRARIEERTNLRAATPYEILSEDERRALHEGLLKLI